MNEVIRTGCISHLAEELGRLEKLEKDISINIDSLTKERTAVQKEWRDLNDALDLILSTKDGQ